jgi:hypothetical protein
MRCESSVGRVRRGSVRLRGWVRWRGLGMGRPAAPLRVGDEGRVFAGDVRGEATLMRSSSSLSCWDEERRRV